MNIKPYLFIIILLCSTAVYAVDYPFPPYYFSADIHEMNRVYDRLTVEKYITADTIRSDIKFINDSKITDKDKEKLERNRAVGDIETTIIVLFGITSKATNMRMYPSNDTLHKGDKRFDYNQYTRISPSTPLAVLHISADKRYYYIQSPDMRGWVLKSDIILYPYDTVAKLAVQDYIIVLKDSLKISGILYNLGDRLPVTIRDGKPFASLPTGKEVLVNVDNDSIVFKSFNYSDGLMLKFINRLLGSIYDWGGKTGKRDCSSFTKDLFSLFNIHLPRNTSLQAQTGKILSDMPESKDEFYRLLDNAKPYLTLIFFKGHVFIYGGKENNDYILYHAVNKLRNDYGDDINFNKVVKTKIKEDKFTDIWQRVIRIIEVDSSKLISGR